MKNFILKSGLFLTPLILSILLFVLIDPFFLFGNNKGKLNKTKTYEVAINRDFQSTELFIKNYSNHKYDSFIFGNSRSHSYNIDIWTDYVRGNCFHFGTSDESLYGIARRLEFLDKKKVSIKNVLLILDSRTFLRTSDSPFHLIAKHPLISDKSYLSFYALMFRGFFPKAMIAHLDLHLTGERKPYMADFGIRKNMMSLNSSTNQLSYTLYDSIINNNINLYYKDKEKIFYPRNSSVQVYSEISIGNEQKKLLASIKSIFDSQKTNYKIVINPLYDQFKINRQDIKYLNDMFTKANVFDYSGINEYTESKYNYYEDEHYRPIVSNKIMKHIYH